MLNIVTLFKQSLYLLVLLSLCWINQGATLLIVSQSYCLIQVVDTNSYTKWQTVHIHTRWLLKKPTNLDLHCLQRKDISAFSRTSVKMRNSFTFYFQMRDSTTWLFPLIKKQERFFYHHGRWGCWIPSFEHWEWHHPWGTKSRSAATWQAWEKQSCNEGKQLTTEDVLSTIIYW